MWTVNEVFCRQDYGADASIRAVVDVGSNIGISALYFLTRSPDCRAWLYEPVPRNVERLRGNLAGYEDRYALREVGGRRARRAGRSSGSRRAVATAASACATATRSRSPAWGSTTRSRRCSSGRAGGGRAEDRHRGHRAARSCGRSAPTCCAGCAWSTSRSSGARSRRRSRSTRRSTTRPGRCATAPRRLASPLPGHHTR